MDPTPIPNPTTGGKSIQLEHAIAAYQTGFLLFHELVDEYRQAGLTMDEAYLQARTQEVRKMERRDGSTNPTVPVSPDGGDTET